MLPPVGHLKPNVRACSHITCKTCFRLVLSSITYCHSLVVQKKVTDWNLALIEASHLLQSVSSWPLQSLVLSEHPWTGLPDPQPSTDLLLGPVSVSQLFPRMKLNPWLVFFLVPNILPTDERSLETWLRNWIASLGQTCFEPKCQNNNNQHQIFNFFLQNFEEKLICFFEWRANLPKFFGSEGISTYLEVTNIPNLDAKPTWQKHNLGLNFFRLAMKL